MMILEYIVISLFVVVISVCSLGILFYPSLSGSYYYYYQKHHTKESLSFSKLFYGLKKGFKQTVVLSLIQLIVIYITYVNYTNFGIFGNNPIIYYGMIGSAILITLILFYTLQLVTYFEVKISRAVVLSNMFLIIYLFSTITMIVLFAALILSIYLQPPFILIVLGLFIHISSKIFIAIFKKHSPEEVNIDEK